MIEHRRIASIAAILIVAIVSAPVITVLMRDRNAFADRDERQKADDRPVAQPPVVSPIGKPKQSVSDRLTTSTPSEESTIGSTVKEEKARTRATLKGASSGPADDAEKERDKDSPAGTTLAQTKKNDMRREAFAENADENFAPAGTTALRKATAGTSAARAGENTFLAAAQYSESTFTCGTRSATMNTLSQYLQTKRMPPPQVVTPEGLVNTAGYSDDIPPIAVTHTSCPWNTAHTMIVVAVGRPAQGEVITVAFSEAVRDYRLIARGSTIPSGPNACIAVYEIVPANTVDAPILARATRSAPIRSALAAPAITVLSSAPTHVRYAISLVEFGLLVSGSAYKGAADYTHAIALAEETRITGSIVSMIREMKAIAENR